LSFFLVPSRSSSTPLYPQSVTSQGLGFRVEAEVPNAEPLASEKVFASKTLFCNKTQFHKVIVDVSKEITLFVVEQMKDFDSNVQHIMFEFFFLHPLLNGVLPNYLGDLKCVRQNHEILSNMKVEITTHLTGPRKSDLVVAK